MFYFNGAVVSDIGDALRQKATAVQDDLDTLDGKVQTVLSQWEGAAQTAYHTAQADWGTKMTDLRTCLTNIGTKIEDIVTTYHDSDRQGASLFEG